MFGLQHFIMLHEFVLYLKQRYISTHICSWKC